MRSFSAFAFTIFVALTGAAGAAHAQNGLTETGAAPSAAIVMYHRFGETEYPSTSIGMDQFAAHIEELTSGKYTVLPLSDVVAAIRAGTPLPDRTVAITIDDAYSSVYERAWPVFQREKLPFTLFVATDPVDRGVGGYMSWEQLAELKAAGVEIGSQAVTHPHMPTQSVARIRRELTDSADRIEEMLGTRPAYFAYPYGETSLEIMKLAEETGYEAAFGQHSGVAHGTLDRFYLPRFPLNVNYGAIDRFRRLINALPLPVEGLTPRDPLLPADGPGNPPAFGFTAKIDASEAARLNCFHSDASQMTVFEKLGTRIEARFDSAFAAGRTRINCTVQSEGNRWRWFGMQYYVAPP